jgi:hypothetical protein
MNNTKKQWIAPSISDLEVNTTLGGAIGGPGEDAEWHT